MALAGQPVTIVHAAAADHAAAGYAAAAHDLAEGRRLLLKAAAALRSEPFLPVGPTTHVTKQGFLHIGSSPSGTTLADIIGRVADRIEAALVLECPALRQAKPRRGVTLGHRVSHG